MDYHYQILKTWQELQYYLSRHEGLRACLVDPKGMVLTDSALLPALCACAQNSIQGKNICTAHYQKMLQNFPETPVPEPFLIECAFGLTICFFPLLIQNKLLGAVTLCGFAENEEQAAKAQKQIRRLRSHFPAGSPPLVIPCLPRREIIRTGHTALPYIHRLREILHDHGHLYRTPAHKPAAILHDRESGLPNKDYLLERLRQEYSLSRHNQQPLWLALVQPQNQAPPSMVRQEFKQLAAFVQKTVRQTDVVVRYNQGLLAVLMPQTSQQQALKTLERLKPCPERRKTSPRNYKLGLLSCTPAYTQEGALSNAVNTLLLQSKFQHASPAILPRGPAPGRSRYKHRVVVTGLGIVSPLGSSKEAFRRGMFEGRSGVRRLTLIEADNFPCQIGGEVRDFDRRLFVPREKLDRIGRATAFAVGAAKMAIADSGLDLEQENPQKVGVSIGSAATGLEFGETQVFKFLRSGLNEISPYLSTMVFGGAISSEVSIAMDIKAPSITLSNGCAAGTDAIGNAVQQIRNGKVKIMLAGGVEAPLRQVIFGSFCSINALSTRYNQSPERASRPFDKNRDGFVMAEGAGVLLLEELQHALRRGAAIYGEILGFGASSDAYHMSRPAPDGNAAAAAVRMALKDAGLETRHIEYLNAHGSSTPLNDLTETRIIKEVFGKHAFRLSVSSTKSMLGHAIGASGAMELIACLLGMEGNFIPPTINYETCDPECDLDYVPNRTRRAVINIFMSNSFGFGGKNACIVVSRY